jgi:hypothetical protein
MKSKMLFLLLFISFITFAQDIEPIQADRPDQTETPSLVPKGMFQVEAGFSYQKENDDSDSFALPSVLWKHGVNKWFELRLITEFVKEKNEIEDISGFNTILVGCKIKMFEEKGLIPKTSFIGHVLFPSIASTQYKTNYYAPEFRFVMQHTLSEKFSLSYNLGSEWNGETNTPVAIYTLTTGYSITNKLGSYVELFGFAPKNDKANHSFDGGITYLINNNFMLDLSSGFGITENAPDYYVAVGFSFRI